MVKQRILVISLSGIGAVGFLIYLSGWLLALRPQTPLSSTASGSIVSQNMTEIGHVGGLADTVFVSGTLAYAGLGAELAVLDLTNPYTPTRLGFASLPALATDVTVAGHVAYVAAATSGLHLFDIQNPAQPTYLSTYTTTGQIQSVLTRDNLAYLGVSHTVAPYGQVIILDVSNPSLPDMISAYDLDAAVYDLVLEGEVLYAAADYSGLHLLDVSNPNQINPISSHPTPGWARGVAVQGSYAYVIQTNCSGECNGYLSIINISNPNSPTTASNTLLPGSGADLVVSGLYAYLADRNGGLRIMQISNPAAPTLVSWLDTPGAAWALTYHNGLISLADESGGIRIYNVFDPNNIVPLGAYDVTDRPLDVTMNGSWAYVAEWTGVRVVDMSSPTLPVHGPFIPLPDTAEHVAIYGTVAYVAAGDGGGIRILDISDPAHPVPVGFYDTPGIAHRVIIQGDRAYVADGNNGLLILNLSNPTSPVLLGSYDSLGEARDVAVQGNYAFLADQTQGILVLDISNAAAPISVGSSLPFGQSFHIVLQGSVAYVAALNGYVAVLDISTPTNPTLLTTINTGAWVYQVALRDNTLYAAAGNKGLLAYDVSDPANPVLLAFLDTGGSARGITVSGSNLVVADQSGGVSILQEVYTVTGRIADHAGVPQPDVLIQSSGGVTTTTGVSGTFSLALPGGTHLITPILDGFRFSPPSRTVLVGPSVSGVDFETVPAPVSAMLTENAAATLIYTNTQGLPTHFNFPAGAVTAPTTVIVTPTILSLNGALATIGHNFDLAAYQNGVLVPNFLFDAPVVVTMRYSALDLNNRSNAAEMYLGRWNGAYWPDAAATCTPPSLYDHDLLTRQIAVGICQTGAFAFLLPSQAIFLPLLPR